MNLNMLCKKEVLERPKGLLYFLLSLRFPTASRLQRLQKIFDDVLMQEIWMKMKSYFSVLWMYFLKVVCSSTFPCQYWIIHKVYQKLSKETNEVKWSLICICTLRLWNSNWLWIFWKEKKKDTICPFFSRLSKIDLRFILFDDLYFSIISIIKLIIL